MGICRHSYQYIKISCSSTHNKEKIENLSQESTWIPWIPHSSHFFFGQPTPFELESRKSMWTPGNPRGFLADSIPHGFCVFPGNQQGIHMESTRNAWGRVKSSAMSHLSLRPVQRITYILVSLGFF